MIVGGTSPPNESLPAPACSTKCGSARSGPPAGDLNRATANGSRTGCCAFCWSPHVATGIREGSGRSSFAGSMRCSSMPRTCSKSFSHVCLLAVTEQPSCCVCLCVSVCLRVGGSLSKCAQCHFHPPIRNPIASA